MIDIRKILKRAWHILWDYKTLWFFGVLIALTGGSSSFRTSGNAGSGSGYQYNNYNNTNTNIGPFWNSLNAWFQRNIVPLFTHPSQHLTTFIWIGLAILVFLVVAGGIAAILRYVSETALLRMVDDHEQTGAKLGFKQGWRLGWSRRAFRLWVIDLIISLPAIVFLLLLGLLGLVVFFSVRNGNPSPALTILPAVACVFLFLFVFILVMVFLGLLRPFIARKIALEEKNVREALVGGWQMVRQNWKSAALLWLVMIAIGIGTSLLMVVVFILLIPVFILTGLAGLVVAALPGVIALGISHLFTSGAITWVIAVLVALPFFFLILFTPVFFIGGLVEVYTSTAWTLGYREIKALGNLPAVPAAPAEQVPGPTNTIVAP